MSSHNAKARSVTGVSTEEQAHKAGLIVHPWTIDDRWEMWMVIMGGADGIFTNRSELALDVYGRTPKLDIESLWRQIGY